MRVPTVRVANPADPLRYMTINEEDLRDDHVLWPDQAEREGGAAVETLAGDDEAHIALRMVWKMLAHRAGLSADEWRALPAHDRLARLREAEKELDASMAHADQGQTASDDRPRIARGPRGRWYGFRGKERLTGGFDNPVEAQAALDALGGG